MRWARAQARTHGGSFDVALGHGSNDVSVAAAALRIPSATMFDYEWATVQHSINCRLARAVVVPDAIPPERLRRFGAAGKLRRYEGLKEEYYLADFEPDASVLQELGLDRERPIAVLRTPPEVSLYHRFASERFERVLEKMSLTELPQLWNVLRGDMSLVGPRPESPDRVKRYSEWQQLRLSMKPGMTGLAQVHGLRDQNSSEEKTRFDLQYILNPSAVADVSILLQTLWTLAMRLFPYPRRDAAEPNTQGSRLVDEVTPQFVEETLQGAHRSQSSAD